MTLHPDVTHPRTIRRFETLESDLLAIFGDKLDFTDSVFSGVMVKVRYWCNSHDDYYEAIPNSLLKGIGCRDCGTEAMGKNQFDKARDKFKAEAELKHPNKYDYTMVWYRNAKTKVMIWCKTHNHFFWAIPASLLRGSGCGLCGNETTGKTQITKARLNFPARAEAIHPNKNYYHLVDYKGTHIKVTLYCIDCGVPYEIAPSQVLKGQGHSDCSVGGFKPNLPAILYYLRVETYNRICWKIGITNLTVQDRFSNSDLELITEIRIIHYDNGQDAYDEEQRILKLYKEHQYLGDPLLNSGGNTELFTKDVLGLDLEY